MSNGSASSFTGTARLRFCPSPNGPTIAVVIPTTRPCASNIGPPEFPGETGAVVWIIRVGLTLTLFQHMASGVRHLFMDAGDNFELGPNKTTALMTFGFAILATAAFWAVLLLGE